MDFRDDDELVPEGELDVRTAALQATVAFVVVRPCADCGAALCGHGAVLAVVLGFRNSPRCARCLSRQADETPAGLAERALQWILRRECFLHVWRRASASEGHADRDRPACLFAANAAARAAPAAAREAETPAGALPKPAATWDAGDLGCGDLVLELRERLRALPPGAVLAVRAADAAAPVDLPAWCGLCGHTLRHASHPHYLIQNKRV
ncbi:MAG TPA: sulfurtransferase TusA family protein [Planctomycetota bacterium]|nr:sulfurtransferase TusA family protein [Planctomycetota bacterium]